MKAKKIVSILVSAAILVGLLSACGGKRNIPGTSSQAPGSTSRSQPQTPDGSAGEPPAEDGEDFQIAAQAMVDATAQYDDGKTAICFMGHGTEAQSNAVYGKMQKILTDGGHANYFVGTVEAEPSLDTVLELVKAGDYEKVVLQPMMIAAGDHANNDMAGEDEDTWKSAFEGAGYQVECVLKGLGEYEAIRQLLVDHVKDAIAK